MAEYKLVQVRADGRVNESHFIGYHSETAMIHFREIAMIHFREIAMIHFREIAMIHFREIARKDPKTVATLVFEASGREFVPYTIELHKEFQT